MDNNKNLSNELLKQEGVGPARVSDKERAKFKAVLDEEMTRVSRGRWTAHVYVWLAASAFWILCFSVRLQEALHITYGVARVPLGLLLCIVLIPMSVHFLYRCARRRKKLRQIITALPEYADKAGRGGFFAIGARDGRAIISWPDVITLGLTICVLITIGGGFAGYQLIGYWLPGPFWPSGLLGVVVAVGLVCYLGVKRPMRELSGPQARARIVGIVLKSRITKLTVAGAALGLLVFSIYVAQYGPDPQDTVILGQAGYYCDSIAALRVLVRNNTTGRPVEGATVRLAMEGQGIKKRLGEFVTGEDGSVSDAVYIPSVPPGRYRLIVASSSEVGRDYVVRQVDIKRPYRLYVTTDKPIYQPGQTLHMRAIALNRVSLEPFSEQPIIFEVEGPKGNKVFKVEVTTSEYGIGWADFDIADEVNLGRYRIRAIAGDVESEKVVTVKHYVLPKFKVEVSTNRSYYLPSDEISGTVQANYFFGKPVANSHVLVIGRTMIEKPTEIFRIKGVSNESGEFAFRTRLGDYFTGMPLAGGSAFLEIEAVVTDTAGHEEKTSEHRVVAQQPINIHVVPESGASVPNVENIIYIFTAYPDGQPAVCRINVNGSVLETDESGIAVFRTTPNVDGLTLNIRASDELGNTGTVVRQIDSVGRFQDYLLRTDKAVYFGGETVNATILSAIPRATFFLDIIKDSQTMLTKTVPLEEGRRTLAIDLPPHLFGTLKLNAYTITATGQSRTDSRIIYVHQANELDIETSLDKSVYRPGEMAKVSLRVTDNQGTATAAALSLCAVDEAVFYVGENRPGLLEQFFLADEELLKPAYQIKFAVSPAKLLSGDDEYQNLARALFSSSVQPRSEASILDKLVEEDYMEPRQVERLRRYMREGYYDELLAEPQYAHLAKVLKPESDYTLYATTYKEKAARAEAFRERYFAILKTGFIFLIVGGFVLCLLSSLFYSTYKLVRRPETEVVDTMHLTAQRAANGMVHTSALLFVFPVVTYLSSLLLCGVLEFYYDIYVEPERVIPSVFVANVLFVAWMCVLQLRWSLSLANFKETQSVAWKMLTLPVIFITQYAITRTIIISSLYARGSIDEEHAFIAGALSLAVTVIIYFAAVSIASQVASRCRLVVSKPGAFFPMVVVALTLFLGSSILMPSLARVKELSARVTAGSNLAAFAMVMDMSGYSISFSGGTFPKTTGDGSDRAAPRVRRYFPETLLWYPELITDDAGEATLDVAMADSITTWRMNIDAVSAAGRLGSSEVGIRVFQDFFVDLDLPVALTRNDEISIPVACYNYLQQPQTVQLDLEAGSWYELQGPSSQEVSLAPNEVRSVMFRIKAKDVGTHELTLMARGDRLSDALQRRIDVRPDGSEVEDLQSGVLALSAEHTFDIPPEAIANSESLILKLYPSTFSEVVEGLENIFRMPSGCFEQTSSTTYPNVMALEYMKRTKQATPEIEIKARKFITAGYQRLLTFEVAGGGFDWYGHPPADAMLTAYGILEFTDMSKVHNIDPAVIDRASKWLMSKQNADGSWNPSRFLGRLQGGKGNIVGTAYVTWALTEAGNRGKQIDAALDFLRQNIGSTDQAYTIALTANAFLACDSRDIFGRELLTRLRSKFQVQEDCAYLGSSGTGAIYSRGRCLDIETTSLATLAMIKGRRYPDVVKKALTWLSQQKDAHGTWHSTQATILAMKALIAGTGEALSSDRPSNIRIVVNGQLADRVAITPEVSDVLHMVVLTDHLKRGHNTVHITQDEEVEIAYRLVGTYWVPTEAVTAEAKKELEIQVDYDKVRLAVDDILTCKVEVINNTGVPLSMAIIDLGIPPGFRVDPSAFGRLVEARTLAKYELTGNQCILYVRGLEPSKSLRFSYELKALYPIRAKIPPSRVYEYYRPENEHRTMFQDVVVEGL